MKSEVNAVMLFIAELTGSFVPGSGNMQDKIKAGQRDYVENKLHTLDLADEGDRKELHENMWLERLYDELDRYFEVVVSAKSDRRLFRHLSVSSGAYREATYQWTVPVELDATASMIQYEGILLNDKRMMNMTNVIGDTLEDCWKIEGIDRGMFKKAATPMLYGSSQKCYELWQDAGQEYTAEDVATYTKEMNSGPFGLANMFKDFIIRNCNPQAEMKVKIDGAEFVVHCNRFKTLGDKKVAYKMWDTVEKRFNTVMHTETIKIPDLEQFRRYFVTLLIHHLDSAVMDTVASKCMDKYDFGIPIHDALVCSPAAAADVRKWYAEELNKLHRNRTKILTEYFESIGITSAATAEWIALQNKVVSMEGELDAQPMALK